MEGHKLHSMSLKLKTYLVVFNKLHTLLMEDHRQIIKSYLKNKFKYI